jgi:hypothetical protein
MMPTQEEIDDARETYRQWQPEVPADSFDPPMEADEAIRVMDAAYRAEKERTDRCTDELVSVSKLAVAASTACRRIAKWRDLCLEKIDILEAADYEELRAFSHSVDQEARAELAERQYAELKIKATEWARDITGEWSDNTYEVCANMIARHEAEQKALASQAVDKASDARNDADASGDLPAR